MSSLCSWWMKYFSGKPGLRCSCLRWHAPRFIRAFSVFGQTFWRGGIAALLGLPKDAKELEDSLSSLLDAELIQVQAQSRLAEEKEYNFRHALVRDATYSLLTNQDLTLGHRLTGEWPDAIGLHDALALAEHYARGNVPERASHWYRRSAEQALAENDLPAAIERFEKAIGHDQRPEVHGPIRAGQRRHKDSRRRVWILL